VKPLAQLLDDYAAALELPMPKDGICFHLGFCCGKVGKFTIMMADGGFVSVYCHEGEATFSTRVFDVIKREVESVMGPIRSEWNGIDGSHGISMIATRRFPAIDKAIANYRQLADVFQLKPTERSAMNAFHDALARNVETVRARRHAK
jgi:hypothetical protein